MKAIMMLMAVAAVALVIATIASAATVEGVIADRLQEEGIRATSTVYSAAGCESGDLYTYKWTGVDEDGEMVQGFACGGLFSNIKISYQ